MKSFGVISIPRSIDEPSEWVIWKRICFS